MEHLLDWHTHLSPRQHVACQFDFGEVALPDGLEQPVVADGGLLIGEGGDGVPAPGQTLPTGRLGGRGGRLWVAIHGGVL